jgi:hypothetical protein
VDRKFQADVKQITATEFSDLFFQERYEEGILWATERLITLIKNKESNRLW